MRIQEFRDMIKTADRTALEKIAADLYRRIPKKAKEEEVDQTIDLILKGEAAPKAVTKSVVIAFDQLEAEINTFLSHVDAGYYWEPNRVVPKQQRSKWRFTVMRFLKQLDAIPAEDEHAQAAAKLYLEIYNRLAYGSGYYIFPTEDPFRAIGKRQGDFYPVMVAKFFSTGYSDDKILDMLRAATSTLTDRETLHIEMEQTFIRDLHTRDMREKAYAIAKEEVARLEAKISQKTTSMAERDVKEKINEITNTIIGLGIALYEEDDAMKFYLAHHKEYSKEIQLYVALKCIDYFGGSNDLWLNTYEDAIKQGLKPRDRLVNEYEERKKG